LKNRLLSFKAALHGVKYAFKSEWNLRFHLIAAIVSILLAYFLKLNRLEISIVLLCIGLVISMELINTSIEYLCDFIHPEKNDAIKKIKDISAAAVLISSIVSFLVGLALFLPKILDKFKW
jgi:undecaprenol kinase/diacylglycerol kinase (ATP)